MSNYVFKQNGKLRNIQSMLFMLMSVTTHSITEIKTETEVSRRVSKATAGTVIIQKEITLIIFHKQVITSEHVIRVPARQTPLAVFEICEILGLARWGRARG